MIFCVVVLGLVAITCVAVVGVSILGLVEVFRGCIWCSRLNSCSRVWVRCGLTGG